MKRALDGRRVRAVVVVALVARLLGSMTDGASADDVAAGGDRGGHEDRSVDAS